MRPYARPAQPRAPSPELADPPARGKGGPGWSRHARFSIQILDTNERVAHRCGGEPQALRNSRVRSSSVVTAGASPGRCEGVPWRGRGRAGAMGSRSPRRRLRRGASCKRAPGIEVIDVEVRRNSGRVLRAGRSGVLLGSSGEVRGGRAGMGGDRGSLSAEETTRSP